MDRTATLAIGLTSSKLPICIIPKDRKGAFANIVEELCEGRIQADFLSWLRQETNLVICWIMGFKPRGDDARPDRGLAPLTRMLIGDTEDLLTVIYGPASSSTWERLHNTPRLLLNNGLWEAIFDASNAILVDSSTDGIRRHGYLRPHWHEERTNSEMEAICVQPQPLHIGENDVDTVIHLLLAHHGGTSFFEGMCNPPGGDWSGISLQSTERSMELRWLTLPRVSDVGAKRPDHVFQIFKPNRQPIILCVESKETAASVELNIGQRLISYIQTLISSPASIERRDSEDSWEHSSITLDYQLFTMASAVAFLDENTDRIEIVRQRANADLLMCFSFLNNGDSCSIRIIPNSSLGTEIANIICAIPLQETNINVVVVGIRN